MLFGLGGWRGWRGKGAELRKLVDAPLRAHRVSGVGTLQR